nr:uncharacterized protein LOC101253656 [Solanum lycopersicum]
MLEFFGGRSRDHSSSFVSARFTQKEQTSYSSSSSLNASRCVKEKEEETLQFSNKRKVSSKKERDASSFRHPRPNQKHKHKINLEESEPLIKDNKMKSWPLDSKPAVQEKEPSKKFISRDEHVRE